jgi:aspartyl aminopeptidase
MAKQQNLAMEPKSTWETAGEAERKGFFAFAKGYCDFLNHGRTERLAVEYLRKLAEQKGFLPLEKQKKWQAGARVYAVNRQKNIVLAVLGKQPLEQGAHIIASHLDAPRLDLKQRPLSQDDELQMALLRTHYYGGVKKYQWVNLPLGLFGRAVRRNGSCVDIAIGADPDDPCFVIPDILPHLNKKDQAERKAGEVLKGEELLIICGGIPVADAEVKQRVKAAVLEHLHKLYQIEEEDLISAELEAVPLTEARFVGFDRSFLGGYGHDDKICSYTSVMSLCDLKIPERTSVVACVDKEEIGSEGNTGMQSSFLYNFLGELMALADPRYPESSLRRCLARSMALSADVNAAVEPNFKNVHEISNACKAGFGLVITKYTGHGGKSGASDASAEFVGKVRKIFNDAKVPWQAAAMGKVDEGGGGTVAKFLAEYGMDILDCGPGLMSMHSPFELVSVADLHSAYLGYKAFLSAK